MMVARQAIVGTLDEISLCSEDIASRLRLPSVEDILSTLTNVPPETGRVVAVVLLLVPPSPLPAARMQTSWEQT